MIVSLVYPQTTRRLLWCQAHMPSKYYGFHDVARLFTVFTDDFEVFLNGDT